MPVIYEAKKNPGLFSTAEEQSKTLMLLLHLYKHMFFSVQDACFAADFAPNTFILCIEKVFFIQKTKKPKTPNFSICTICLL